MNAVALPNDSATDVQQSFVARLVALPAKSQVALGVGIAAIVGVVLAMSMWTSHADYRVLFANLSDKDGGAVIAQLSQMNVPFKYSEGGSAILIPASKVHDVRLKLASAGLPKGSVVGFELMDGAKFGQTQFQERLTFQRGLEGELVRSILTMDAVDNARVHLALPNQNGFFREQQRPSASVMLSLKGGRTLERGQIAGIVHLVASSVPELNPKSVSVLDQSGALLSSPSDDPNAGLDAQQLQYVRQMEANYTKRIVELLEPVVGRENLRATVTADIDFSQSEATSEEFRPNQGKDALVAIRSQQTSEQSGSNGAGATGIPGATSNQPPAQATAPLTGASAPLQTAQNGSLGGSSSSNRQATTNYEVDKTVRVTRNATGLIKRLNAAVVVNHRSVTDAKGKTTQVPLTGEEIEKLSSLVRESIGFKQERGDSVKLVNAPFKLEPVDKSERPVWKDPALLDMLRSAAAPAGLAFLGLLIWLGMIRPALRAATVQAVAGQQLNAVVDDAQSLPMPSIPALEPPKPSEHLIGARQLAQQNPAAVANIVRGWVSNEVAS